MKFMSNLDLTVLIIGVSMLINPLVARYTKKLPITPAMVYVFIGLLLGMSTQVLPAFQMSYSDEHARIVEHFTEIVVVMTLVSAGIKIDRPFDRKWWSNTWRLLGITMVSTIAAITAAGYYLLQLPLAVAILLGAVMAPTDPVLAHDMQTGPPLQDNPEHHVRFTLTTEAGFNDGLAFPFTYLAMQFYKQGASWPVFWEWFGWDLFARVSIGLAVGYLMGKVMGWFLFQVVEDQKAESMMSQHFGIFVLGATLATYSLCELLSGYGFLAVFIAAVMGRSHNREHRYHKKTFKFLEQIEESLTCILLLMLGAAAAYQGWAVLSLNNMLIALGTVFLIRPIAGMLGMLGCESSFKDRFAVSFLGVRGIGSFYYLAYAATHFNSDAVSTLTQIVLCTVMLSIVVHGIGSDFFISKKQN